MRVPTVLRRARMAVIVAGLMACTVPAAAGAAEAGAGDTPTVRTAADGSVTYRDPAVADDRVRTVTGRLRELSVEDGQGSRSAVITTTGGAVVPVALDASVPVSDAPVTAQLVDGPELDAALAGKSSAPVEVASARTTSTASGFVTSPQRAYVAVVTNSGSNDLASSSTLETQVDKGLSWWAAESGGAISSFTRPLATVRFASKLGSTARCGVSSDPTAVWTEAAKKFPSVDFNADGNHLIVIVSGGCAGTGIGTMGSSITSGGMVAMIQTASIFPLTITHELGHNFSLDHANYCTGSCGAVSEYWNLYSIMGLAVGGGQAYDPPALDSVYRQQLGVTGAGEIQRVGAGQDATISLSPRGSLLGVRGVQVTSGSTSYWVDWRSGTGRDAKTFYAVANGRNALGNGRTYPTGVTIMRQRTGSDEPTVLMTRTAAAASWAAGQTFTAGSVSITVTSIGSTAKVTVNNGTLATISAKKPTISGTRKVGKTLTAVPGAWSPKPTFSYQWYANGKAIAKATKSSFKLTKSQRGRKLTVKVTGKKTGYLTTSKTSSATAKVS